MKNFPEAFVPSVPLQLEIPTKAGKQVLNFKLTFDFAALAVAEEKLGVSMLTLSPKVWVDMTAKTLSILVWAGVQRFDSDYEGEEGLAAIRSYLFGANYAPALVAVNEAYIAVQSEPVQKLIRGLSEKDPEKTSPNDQAAQGESAAQ